MANTFNYTGGYLPMKITLSKADSYALADAEKGVCVGVTMTAASKVLTLGLANGQYCIVINDGGTNAFTVKNIAGDTGTSVAAGKIALCIGGSGTADTFTAYVLN